MTAAVPNNKTKVVADGFPWFNHSAEVIHFFKGSDLPALLQLSLANCRQPFSNFHLQTLGPMKVLSLLCQSTTLKRRVSLHFKVMQKNLFFLISLLEHLCDASEIAASACLLALLEVSPHRKLFKKSNSSGCMHSCCGNFVTIGTNRKVFLKR